MATMEITTTIGCPLACTFCPQDKLRAVYPEDSDKIMSLKTFQTILEKTPEHVRIDFSGMSEPWSNPRATEMLDMALRNDRKVAVYTTLHGITVCESEKITELLVQRADNIVVVCLHLPDSKMNMRGYRGSEKYRNVLRNFLKMVEVRGFPKKKLEMMTMDASGLGRVHADLDDIVPNLAPWNGHTRAGNLKNEVVQTINPVPTPYNTFSLSCIMTPFYDHNVVLPNGDVLLCCMDYSMKHKLGNLLEIGYWDLFSSPELSLLRIKNQRPVFSSKSICKTCTNAARHVPYYDPL